MRQLLLLSSLFVLFSCKGQKETSQKVFSFDKFAGHYNKKQYDSIFNMFSPQMKEALPLEKTIDFFNGLYAGSGTIDKFEIAKENGDHTRYKTDLQGTLFWFDITLNKAGEIDGLYVVPYDGPDKPDIPFRRNETKLSLPFRGEWFVFWGGDTKEQNYHVINRAQKNAFDIVVVNEKGRSFRTNGLTNEDYYAFGQELIAPCDAEVVAVTEGVKDNIPGEMNSAQVTGNTVVLKTAVNEYLLFAHFKLNSIKVKVGDKVKQGQLLGLCGNSGNSSEPHLHFHIQDKESMAGATGIKCYFEKILVNGKEITDHSPVKGERIKNLLN